MGIFKKYKNISYQNFVGIKIIIAYINGMKQKLFVITVFFFINQFVLGQALQLFGGRNHDVYLGCLNCNKFDKNSIWNSFGNYGSTFGQNSIWNEFGNFGSNFSANSPWNSYSTTPPVVVDDNGNFYGYFTVNAFQNNRADFGLALTIYKYHDNIKKDVSGWYDEIFSR